MSVTRPTSADLDAVHLAGDEVHNARNSVRTVSCRCAAGQDINTLQRNCRNLANIRSLRLSTAGLHTAAIDKNQSSVGSHTTQIDRGGTGRAVGDVRILARLNRRQAVHYLLDVDEAEVGNFFCIDHGHRAGSTKAINGGDT